jgi:hypothetical protein
MKADTYVLLKEWHRQYIGDDPKALPITRFQAILCSLGMPPADELFFLKF